MLEGGCGLVGLVCVVAQFGFSNWSIMQLGISLSWSKQKCLSLHCFIFAKDVKWVVLLLGKKFESRDKKII